MAMSRQTGPVPTSSKKDILSSTEHEDKERLRVEEKIDCICFLVDQARWMLRKHAKLNEEQVNVPSV